MALASDLVGVENVVPIGVRSCSKEEMADAEKLGLKYVSAFDVRAQGITATISGIHLAAYSKKLINYELASIFFYTHKT